MKKYFVTTTVTSIQNNMRSTHMAYYNFTTGNWQRRMNKQCITTDYNAAQSIYSTRVLINSSTQLNIRLQD